MYILAKKRDNEIELGIYTGKLMETSLICLFQKYWTLVMLFASSSNQQILPLIRILNLKLYLLFLLIFHSKRI